MSDDILHQPVLTSSGLVYTFPENIEHGTVEEMNAICDLLDSLPDLHIPDRASPGGSHVMGYHNGKMFRIEIGGGLLVTPLSIDSDGMEEGFIYQTPQVAIAWLLCKLGYGTNSSNFETDVVVFQSGPAQPVVRMAFESGLNPAQTAFYESMGVYGLQVVNKDTFTFGACRLDEIKALN